jgi:hypothetical protein
MDAKFILASIIRHHSGSAIVPELTISDNDWLDHWVQGDKAVSSRRIDALMFEGLQRTAIEIKVTKADFKADTWAKRRAWAKVVHRFIYAVPEDLDVQAPYGCGLWRVNEYGRVTVDRKATIQKYPEHLPQDVIQRIAYRAAGKRSSHG